MPGIDALGERGRRIREQPDALQDGVGDQREHHVQLEIARRARHADRRVARHDRRRGHRHGFRDHRVDLAGHDAGTGLQGRQRDLGEAGERAGVHPAQVVRNLEQHDRGAAQGSRQLDRRVLRRKAREAVRRAGERKAGARAEARDGARGKLRVRVDARADGRRAEREPVQARAGRLDARDRVLDLRLPRGHLLAHGDGQRVHEMRAPGLHLVADLARLRPDGGGEPAQGRQQPVAHRECGGDVDGGRDDVVAALAAVDVVVGMDRLAEAAAREVGDDLVDVHVGAGAGAGLVDAERKLVGVTAGRDLERRVRDRRGKRRRQLAELAVRLGCGPLDQPDRADELRRHAVAADAEVVGGTLRLGAPERPCGDADLAEAVLFDAVLVAHG